MAAPGTTSPGTVPELSGGAHFPCLDAYRGIGMLMVLLSPRHLRHRQHAERARARTSRGSTWPSRCSSCSRGSCSTGPYASARLHRPDAARAAPVPPAAVAAHLPRLLGRARSASSLLFGAGRARRRRGPGSCNLLLLQQFGVDEPHAHHPGLEHRRRAQLLPAAPRVRRAMHRWITRSAGDGSGPAGACSAGARPARGRLGVPDPRGRHRPRSRRPVVPRLLAGPLAQLAPDVPRLLRHRHGPGASGAAVPRPGCRSPTRSGGWATTRPPAGRSPAAIFLLVAQMDPPADPVRPERRRVPAPPGRLLHRLGGLAGPGDLRRPVRGPAAPVPRVPAARLARRHLASASTCGTSSSSTRPRSGRCPDYDELEGLARPFAGNFWTVSVVAIVATTRRRRRRAPARRGPVPPPQGPTDPRPARRPHPRPPVAHRAPVTAWTGRRRTRDAAAPRRAPLRSGDGPCPTIGPAAARHHPGQERGGGASRRSSTSCARSSPTSTWSWSTTAPPTRPPRWPPPPGWPWCRSRSTSASAGRCAAGSATPSATATSGPCSSTPTASTTPPRSRRCSPRSTTAPTW